MSQGRDKIDREPTERIVRQSDTAPTSPNRQSRVTARPTTESTKRERMENAAVRRAEEAARGDLQPPSADELLFTVLELNRTVSVEMQDEAIVHGYVEALRVLFPRRRLVVRLIEGDSTIGLGLVYATGRLSASTRDRISLSRDAIERHELSVELVAQSGAVVVDDYEPVFEVPGEGLHIPLVSHSQIVGVMNVEYEPGVSEPPFDRSLIVPIAVQLTAALHNARLLRESNYLRDNLGKLLDHANAPIAVIGRDRSLRVVNRALLSMISLEREDLLGRDFLTLLPETERGRMLPVFIRALRGEPTTNFEVRIPRTAGGYSRLVVNTASILAGDGEVEGVIAIGRDLTEVRELEEQIIQAEKLATLGQLAAGVVHELNNPLTSISIYSEYLLAQSDTRRGHSDPGRHSRSSDASSRTQRGCSTVYPRPRHLRSTVAASSRTSVHDPRCLGPGAASSAST